MNNLKPYSKQYFSASLIYLLVIIIFQFLPACKSTELRKTVIKDKPPRFLLEQLKNSELNYDLLSAKLSTDAEINGQKYSVSIKLRIRKDSAIWMSVSPALGIEMARVLITDDSLKFINRLNSTYFTGSFDYLNRLIQADINFGILQSLLTGNCFSLLFDDTLKEVPDDKFQSSIDVGKYLLSSSGNRKHKKPIEDGKSLSIPIQRIWLDPESFKVIKLYISGLSRDGRELEVTYSEFKKIDDQVFPHNVNFKIKGDVPIRGTLNYSKISFDKSLEFPFTIPENYAGPSQK